MIARRCKIGTGTRHSNRMKKLRLTSNESCDVGCSAHTKFSFPPPLPRPRPGSPTHLLAGSVSTNHINAPCEGEWDRSSRSASHGLTRLDSFAGAQKGQEHLKGRRPSVLIRLAKERAGLPMSWISRRQPASDSGLSHEFVVRKKHRHLDSP